MPNDRFRQDAARLSKPAWNKKQPNLRVCLRCKRPVKKPYWFHHGCQKLEQEEFRARIEALPTKVLTEEQVRRLFKPEIEESPLKRAIRARSIEHADAPTSACSERKECC